MIDLQEIKFSHSSLDCGVMITRVCYMRAFNTLVYFPWKWMYQLLDAIVPQQRGVLHSNYQLTFYSNYLGPILTGIF